MKQDANNHRKKHLELFARLANIEDLGVLKDWEKLHLVSEMREAGFSWLPVPSTKAIPGHQLRSWVLELADGTLLQFNCHPQLFQTWGREEQVPLEWQVLLDAHEGCRPILNDLLDGKEVNPIEVREVRFLLLRLDAQTGRLQYRSFGNDPTRTLRGVFEGILRQDIFPFRRCLACRAVFVPGKNQKYCTPACLIKGTEARRKDERRGYMREYMAKKRAKKKQPVVKIRGGTPRNRQA